MNQQDDIVYAITKLIEHGDFGAKDRARLEDLSQSLDDHNQILKSKAIELTQANSKNPQRSYENFISKLNKAIEDIKDEIEEDDDLLSMFSTMKFSHIKTSQGDKLNFAVTIPKTLSSTVLDNSTYDEDIFVESGGADTKTNYIFISYASDDLVFKNSFVSHLESILQKQDIDFEFDFWEMKDIKVGSDFHSSIITNIQKCDYGFVLVSKSLVKSKYIVDHELPPMLKEDKIFPIGLVGDMKEIFKATNKIEDRVRQATVKELTDRQIFMLKDRVGHGDFFDKCADNDTRDKFISIMLEHFLDRDSKKKS